MGLLDSLIGAASQAMNNHSGAMADQAGHLDLSGLLGSLMGNGAVQGGLAGLLEQLQAGGLGEQVKSWISQGSNLPVSADQIASALGGAGGTLGQLADALGLSHGQAADQLAQHLPQLVDQVTPDGQLPAHDSVSELLGRMMNGSPAR